MASPLVASQSLVLQNPVALLSPNSLTALSPPLLPTTIHHQLLRHGPLSELQTISFYSSAKLPPSLSLPNNRRPATTVASSSTLVHNPPSTNKNPQGQDLTQSLLTDSTRTVTTLLVIALTAAKFLAHKVLDLAVQLKGFDGLRPPLNQTAGPAFFAAIRDTSTRTLNTPFTVVAAGMAKWLDIYSGVLMVRVLLSWFPNIPWDRQPLSAIRDLCDPYLNLFRNIIPPVFDTLDVSPLLAFAVLGTLGSILKSSRGF